MVCVSPAFQTTPLVGYVTGGAATSNTPRATNGLAFTIQETYARAKRAREENESMFTSWKSVGLEGLKGEWEFVREGDLVEALEVEPAGP